MISQEEIGAIADAYIVLKKAMPELTLDDWQCRVVIAEALREYGKYRAAINLVQSYKNEIEDQNLVSKILVILSDSFAKVPGREKHAEYYRQLLALHKSAT